MVKLPRVKAGPAGSSADADALGEDGDRLDGADDGDTEADTDGAAVTVFNGLPPSTSIIGLLCAVA